MNRQNLLELQDYFLMYYNIKQSVKRNLFWLRLNNYVFIYLFYYQLLQIICLLNYE